MQWITRERPKIDRIACPWLILRFIDAQAQFHYVPADRVVAMAKELGATPYDIPGVELTHVGELCSFDAFMKKYQLDDSGLSRLAVIVRGARYVAAGPGPSICRSVCDFAGPLRHDIRRSRNAAPWARNVRRLVRLVLEAAARNARLASGRLLIGQLGFRTSRRRTLMRRFALIAAISGFALSTAAASRGHRLEQGGSGPR